MSQSSRSRERAPVSSLTSLSEQTSECEILIITIISAVSALTGPLSDVLVGLKILWFYDFMFFVNKKVKENFIFYSDSGMTIYWKLKKCTYTLVWQGKCYTNNFEL